MLTKKLNSFLGTSGLRIIGMREDYCSRLFYLVDIELTEVLHIHTALIDICNGNVCVDFSILALYGANCAKNVRKLTYSRRLYKNSVGMKLGKNL